MRWLPSAAWAVALVSLAAGVPPASRPGLSQRTFSSPAVDAAIDELGKRCWRVPALQTVFSNCLPMTLDATVKGFRWASLRTCCPPHLPTAFLSMPWLSPSLVGTLNARSDVQRVRGPSLSDASATVMGFCSTP